nr:uncharacterized protein LOC106686140 [Halyomorpha halys]
MGERDNDLRLVRILQGRVCGIKKRRLETYADVVQKQKETPPPEPLQDKPRVLTTLMKVKAIRRKVARRTSLFNMAEDYALSDSCEKAIYDQNCPKRLPYTRCLSESVNA